MPANLRKATVPTDRRLQPGAYITNGEALFFVKRIQEEPAPRNGAPFVRLVVEDCKTLTCRQLEIHRVRQHCRLVQAAPVLDVPDTIAA